MGHEFPIHMLQAMKLFPGASSVFACTSEEQGDRDGEEGELDAQVLALLYSSPYRHFRKWEDVVLDSFAFNYEDHPITRRNESDITQVELTALRWTHCALVLTS